jgi:hypothetical protein
MEDGCVKSYGPPNVVLGNASDLPQELQQEQEQIDAAEMKTDIDDLDKLKGETPESVGAKLILDEEIEIGRVSWDACQCSSSRFAVASNLSTTFRECLLQRDGRQVARVVLARGLRRRHSAAVQHCPGHMVAWRLGAGVRWKPSRGRSRDIVSLRCPPATRVC